MATEYINPQWRLPNEKTGNNQSYSMDFDGSNYIDLGTTLKSYYENVSAVSFSVWVSFKDLSTDVDVLGTWRSSFRMLDIRFLQSTGKLSFRVGNGADTAGEVEVVSSGKIVANTWYHLAMVYDGTQSGNADRLKAYINGSQETLTFTGVIPSTTSNLLNYDFEIGGNRLSEDGSKCIDDVAIFDYALPATGSNSVATLYGSGTPFNPMALASPPIAYYPLGNSAHMGSNYLTPNGALQDYVFSLPEDATVSTLNNFFNSTNFPDGFTASVWVKNWAITGSGGAPQNIFFNGANATNRFELYSSYSSESGFKVWLNVNSTPLYSNSANSLHWSDNTKWVNLVVTWDRANGTLVLYSNGQAGTINTSAPTSWGASNTNTTIFGNDANQSGNVLTSNYQMWNGPISSTEVETLYNYGSPIRTLANIPQSSNLKAWYKLDASEIYNSSSTKWEVNNQTANYKTALDFSGDGNNSGVQIASDLMNGYTNFTWSIWANAKSFPDAANYLFKADGQSYLRESAGSLNFFINIGGTFTPLSAGFNSTNEWSHIVGIVDQANSKMKIFINGVLKATRACGSGTIQTSSPFVVGTDNSLTQYVWDGLLSNAQVWNSVLTDGSASTVGDVAGGEIATLYNNGTPLTSSILQSSNNKLWWKMDNLTTGIQDSSGNSNNGTASNEIVQVDSFVSTLNGESSGMSQSNLVQSDLLTTSSYSPYAMSFNGGNNYITTAALSNFITNDVSVSAWVNFTTLPSGFDGSFLGMNNNFNEGLTFCSKNGVIRFAIEGAIAAPEHFVENTVTLVANQWYHFCGTWDGSTIELFTNGVSQGTFSYSGSITTSRVLEIGQVYNTGYNIHGKLSNIAIWNKGLTSSQVREVYNEGRPSNLHNFSGTAPTAWWQLGSNSSWTSPAWTVLDEIGSNDGTSQNMLQNAIVDGVGTSGNGTSTNMGSANNISGSSPSGEGNSLSVNMTLANIAGGVN